MSLDSTFRQFAKPKICKIDLPRKKGSEPLNCRVKLDSPPYLEVMFPPRKLQPDELKQDGECTISCQSEIGFFTLKVSIEKVLDERRLQLKVQESTSPIQQRKHFRIDTHIKVKYWPVNADVSIGDGPMQKVNLSGGGIRMPIDLPISENQKANIRITLPGPPEEVINASAKLVRVFDFGKGGKEGAFAFLNLPQHDEDRIIAFCIAEQSKSLRVKG